MTQEAVNPEPQIKVTAENLPDLRTQIAGLREQPGKEDEAIGMIRQVREGAIGLGEHEHVVNLFWEEYLIGKHLLMATVSEDENKKGMDLMRNSAQAAHNYIDANSVESMRPRSHRFSGEVAMMDGDTKGAIEHFRTGVSLFEQMSDPALRVNALELSGFLAEALVRDGQIGEGLRIAMRTFDAYDKGDGEALRERDYYTWAVWKSGAATKIWAGFLQRGELPQGEDLEKLMKMLDDTESILKMPEGKTALGGQDFEIRKGEIAGIRFGIDQLTAPRE